MKRYAHVKNGIVINVSNWNQETPYVADPDTTIVLAEGDPNAEIGATYDGEFHYTPPPAPELTAYEIEQDEIRSSAIGKLKGLGLNDAEIASITGG
jgi:hypothetical protein